MDFGEVFRPSGICRSTPMKRNHKLTPEMMEKKARFEDGHFKRGYGDPKPSSRVPLARRRIHFPNPQPLHIDYANREGVGRCTQTMVQLRYKTELCRVFEEGGNCQFGENCTFAHGFAELRAKMHHPKYKTEACRSFHTMGYCLYGTRCHFVHNPDEIGGVSPTGGYLMRKHRAELLASLSEAEASNLKPAINGPLLFSIRQHVNLRDYGSQPVLPVPLPCFEVNPSYANHLPGMGMDQQPYGTNFPPMQSLNLMSEANSSYPEHVGNHMGCFIPPRRNNYMEANESCNGSVETEGNMDSAVDSDTSSMSCSSMFSSLTKEFAMDDKKALNSLADIQKSKPQHWWRRTDESSKAVEMADNLSIAVAEAVITSSS